MRNIEGSSKRTFVHNLPVCSSNKQLSIVLPPYERSKNIQHILPSPSGEKIAIFVEESEPKRTVLEIWTSGGSLLSRRIPLPEKLHGKILYESSFFGGVAWRTNQKEDALVYIAETNAPSTRSFFDESVTKNDSTITGGQHTYGIGRKEDWGEKFTGIAEPKMFLISTETGRVASVDNTPGEGYALGQPVFAPCGNSIVYTCWDAGAGGRMPRKLGSVYCYHRPSQLYSSSVEVLLRNLDQPSDYAKDPVNQQDKPFQILTPGDALARLPRFATQYRTSVDESVPPKLAFLYNSDGFDTHRGVLGLAVMEWDIKQSRAVLCSRKNLVEPMRHPIEKPSCSSFHGIHFPGLFVDSLPADCFSADGKQIVLDTIWGSVTRMITISTEDGTILPLQKKVTLDSHKLVCTSSTNDVFFLQSSPNTPSALYRKSLNDDEEPVLFFKFQPITVSSISSNLSPNPTFQKIKYDLINFKADDNTIFQGILYRPNDKVGKLPLIVVPHGGPHSCYTTSFMPSCSYLCASGAYAILIVNFRGSAGFGQASLESLTGNIGTQDVKDMVDATTYVLDQYADFVDSNRVGICGGSHGGFLAAHLVGQYPSLFKVAAMRNPGTNIATSVTSTDIPDWCYVETFGCGVYDFTKFRGPTGAELVTMWSASPIAHIEKIKAPTLIALGLSDRRVPPSQGLEFFHVLRSRGVTTKLLTYQNSDHALDKPAVEADHWINVKLWFDEHL